MNTVHVNIELARYSDWAFTSAVVALVVAMLLLAFELAYVGGRRADSRVRVLAGSVASSRTFRSGRSTNASGVRDWPSSTSASACW
jgi:hypothetical protein